MPVGGCYFTNSGIPSNVPCFISHFTYLCRGSCVHDNR